MVLSELKINENAMIVDILLPERTRRRFYELGITKNTIVTLVRVAPLLDPIEIKVKGVYLAIRKKEADKITVNKID